MQISPPRRPRSAVTTGLVYWYPCDDMASATGIIREVQQGAHGAGAGTPRPNPGILPGRSTMTGRKATTLYTGSSGGGSMTSLSSTLAIPLTTFTICCWIRPVVAPSVAYGVIFNHFGDASHRTQILVKNTGFFAIVVGASSEDPAPIGPNSGFYNHIALVSTGSTFRVFRNGVFNHSFGTTGNAAYTAPINFGGVATAEYQSYSRDLRIYNRALIDGEVYQIFSEGFVPAYDDPLALLASATTGGGTGFMVPSQTVNMREIVRMVGY